MAWSIAQQGATIAALLTASIALLVISVPLGVGVLVGALMVLVGMHVLARPLEIVGMAEQGSVAAAGPGRHRHHDGPADRPRPRRRRRDGAPVPDHVERRPCAARSASARKLITYQAASTAVSVIYLGTLALAAAWMATRGQITVGQLVTVIALAQFLQGTLAQHRHVRGELGAQACLRTPPAHTRG